MKYNNKNTIGKIIRGQFFDWACVCWYSERMICPEWKTLNNSVSSVEKWDKNIIIYSMILNPAAFLTYKNIIEKFDNRESGQENGNI